MYKLVPLSLICFVGKILSVKDIPNIMDKVIDAVYSKKSIVMDIQEPRHSKRTENIDLFIDRVMESFINPSQEVETKRRFGYIGLYDLYRDVINNKYGRYDRNFKGVFDFGDLVEVSNMLTEEKFLTQLPPIYLQNVFVGGKTGPYFKLSEK